MACIVSVASGKGGVGKSVVASNLALLLAKQGYRVVLADLDVGGADCHVLFGCLRPSHTLSDFIERRLEGLGDAVQPLSLHPRLGLIAGTGETLATANMSYAKKKRLVRHLRGLDTDVVVADIGAGTGYHALDFFLMADLHLLVATPDPTSVLDLYRFVKLAAVRLVLSHFVAHGAVAETLAEHDFTAVGQVLEAVGKIDEEGRQTAQFVLADLKPALVLNRVSGRSRVNVGQLQQLLARYIGGSLSLLGEIPDDDAVGQSIRHYLPVVERAPGSPSAKALAAMSESLAELLRRSADAVRLVRAPA
ncbi:MAG TPA: P-loop NTPase [Nitrospira sp.]|nr:P-loop NTPase [Nitrospira sp.]